MKADHLPVIFCVALIAGCGKSESPSSPAAPPAAGGKADDKKVSRGGGIFGVRDETQNRLILRNIGIACQADNVGRLPQTLDELKEIVKDSPKDRKAVESGEFVLVAGAQPRPDSLFLYEKDADSRGNRLVLMGDGTVHKKNAEEFAMLRGSR
jgi:hypothetical protein